MSYYNTTNSQGAVLNSFKSKAKAQEQVIADYFSKHPKNLYAPSDILRLAVAILEPSTPITSVRRAMTNLTTEGILIKTNTQKQGPQGRPEYLWKYNISSSGDPVVDKLLGV